jgi:hypothetical protein
VAVTPDGDQDLGFVSRCENYRTKIYAGPGQAHRALPPPLQPARWTCAHIILLTRGAMDLLPSHRIPTQFSLYLYFGRIELA